MAKKKSNTSPKVESPVEEPSMYDAAPARRRRPRLSHWLMAAGVMCAAFGFFIMHSTPSTEEPAAEAPGPGAAAQDLLAKEMSPAQPPADGEVPPPPADQAAAAPGDPTAPPADPAATAEMPPPPDVQAADAGAGPAPMESLPEPPPAPAPPAPPQAKAKKSVKTEKKAAKKAPAKKHTLVFSKAGTKVPKALKKDKVLAFLAKKLDGDKTCIPADVSKKDLKSFTAIANFSKSGTLTAVTTQPKLGASKAISACIKKKLSGNTALFKSKTTNRISIALKAK